MSNVLIDEQNMYDIADAIREKTNTDDKLKPAEMAKKIEDITTDEWFKKTASQGTYVLLRFFQGVKTDDYESPPKEFLSTSFPNCTSMGYCFSGSSFKKIDLTEMDAPKFATDITYMFSGCKNLETVALPQISGTSSITNLFTYCDNLKDVGLLDFVNGIKNCSNAFLGCEKLEEVRFRENSINYVISFSSCENLTKESLLSIANGLVRSSNTTRKVTFHSKVIYDYNRFPSNVRNIILSKNWTIG